MSKIHEAVMNPLRAFDVVATSLGRSIILSADSGVFELGDVEMLIWELCDGEHSIEQITAIVCSTYATDSESCLNDVSAFVSSMRTERLLEES